MRQKKAYITKNSLPPAHKNSKFNIHTPSDNLTPMASFDDSKKLVAFDKLMVNDAEENQTDMNLDAEQTQAILNLDGPMLILASAGTGKTRTLMAKVAALLDNSVPTNEIMLVTFTNKAANEMKSRLIAMGYDIHDMWIGTFHNICNRILRENYSKSPDSIPDTQSSCRMIAAN